MKEQQNPKRRILLAVAGLSPQIITETVYALAVEREKPWIPDEIHVITTVEGAKRVKLTLLSKGPAWFERLREDFSLPDIRFDEHSIHVLHDEAGHALNDIKSPADNERAADFICDKVRELTGSPDTELHVSIAGGRKTMGYYLGYALSLYGRPQDRLSHVLVSEPFESSWEFFYPTPYNCVIELRDGGVADTRDARVTLAEIPFVSLRQGLDKRLLEGTSCFSDVVAAARRALQPARLCIDLENSEIMAAGKAFSLPPVQLAMLAVFAHRAVNGEQPLPAPVKDIHDKDWAERFLHQYDRIGHDMSDRERTHKALEKGMDGDYFSTHKSSLHRSLRSRLGNAARPYLIDDGGTRPGRYQLRLPSDAIRFGPCPDETGGAAANARQVSKEGAL